MGKVTVGKKSGSSWYLLSDVCRILSIDTPDCSGFLEEDGCHWIDKHGVVGLVTCMSPLSGRSLLYMLDLRCILDSPDECCYSDLVLDFRPGVSDIRSQLESGGFKIDNGLLLWCESVLDGAEKFLDLRYRSDRRARSRICSGVYRKIAASVSRVDEPKSGVCCCFEDLYPVGCRVVRKSDGREGLVACHGLVDGPSFRGFDGMTVFFSSSSGGIESCFLKYSDAERKDTWVE